MFIVCSALGIQFILIRGRVQFPEQDFRTGDTIRSPAEINYHEDFVNNQNGYENFLGLLHYYATRKFCV